MLVFLIMAGGSGERFWPLSTKQKPKQLLKIFDQKSLIRLAYERIQPLGENGRVFIATNEIQASAIQEEIPELDSSRIIIEPAFRDTAAAIAYGSTVISKYYDNPTICVLASDHLIKDVPEFRKVIRIAEEQAEKGNIVTLGIKPTYPETGYGYIQVSECSLNVPTKSLGFKEKPQLKIATQYFESGHYLWNSGMFIFRFDTIMEALKEYSPNHFNTIMKISEMFEKNEGIRTAESVKDEFMDFEKKSIDFAVMEKADNIMVIPSSFGWNDVGNYTAFDELISKDKDGNAVKNTTTVFVDSHNNIVVSDAAYQRVSLLGVSDMIVVIGKDDILICPKNRNQDIKSVIKAVSEKESK